MFLTRREGEPGAFLVRKAPLSRIRPHFHNVNQFQVVVAGSGKIGPQTRKPITIQYTDKHSPYGPIDAGPEGLCFFNCRQLSTEDTYFMPESRNHLQRPPGRQKVAYDEDIPYRIIRPPDSEVMGQYKLLMGNEDSGPWAELYRRGPGQILPLLPRPADIGQFHIILEGELEVDGKSLPTWSVRYIQGMGAFNTGLTGRRGITILVLCFDKEAWV